MSAITNHDVLRTARHSHLAAPATRSLPTTTTPGKSAPSAQPAILGRSDTVTVLNELDVVALGSLRARTYCSGDRLVAVVGSNDEQAWIPAASVWSDVGAAARPDRLRPIGLAAADSRERSLVMGLSDRLGWEAVIELEAGFDLPLALGVDNPVGDRLLVLDGRIGHDVPTVVVIGPDFVRWGAASSWDGAVHRALYGDDGVTGFGPELTVMAKLLEQSGIGVVAADLSTSVLRTAGIFRSSVQLAARRAGTRVGR